MSNPNLADTRVSTVRVKGLGILSTNLHKSNLAPKSKVAKAFLMIAWFPAAEVHFVQVADTLSAAGRPDLRIVWDRNCTYKLHRRWLCCVGGESRRLFQS